MFTPILAAPRRRVARAMLAFLLCAASPLAFSASTIKAGSLTVGSDPVSYTHLTLPTKA